MKRLLVLVALVSLGALVTPGMARADSPFDPTQADAIAHRLMLATTDLPGDGWSVEDVTTDVDSLTGAIPETDACNKSLTPMVEAASKHPDGTIAGSAAEAFSQSGAGLLSLPTQASVQVDVHEDDQYLDYAMERTRDMLAGPDLGTCLGDLFAKNLGGVLKATVKDVDPWVTAPNSGIARAVEITMGSGPVAISVRMEFYVWLYGNAVVQASAVGPSDKVTSALATALVSTTEANLDREAAAAPAPSAATPEATPETGP